MQTAYFKNIREQILKVVNEANDEIRIAMAWFTSNEILDALLKSIKRGVHVELIILDDPINWLPYAPDFNEFIVKGGTLYIAGRDIGFMHHKFCIIDSTYAITGSYNWTYYAETRNIENIVVSTDEDLVKQYTQEFYRVRDIIQNKATSTPRLTWEDIETMTDANFIDINYEQQAYARAYKLSKTKTIERPKQVVAKPVVQIIDTKRTPISKFNIGIGIDDDFVTFVHIGDKLPQENTEIFYNDRDHRSGINLLVYIGDEQSIRSKVIEGRLDDIVKERTDDNLTIEIKFTLEANGHLHSTIECKQTGKAIDLSHTDAKLVDYED